MRQLRVSPGKQLTARGVPPSNGFEVNERPASLGRVRRSAVCAARFGDPSTSLLTLKKLPL